MNTTTKPLCRNCAEQPSVDGLRPYCSRACQMQGEWAEKLRREAEARQHEQLLAEREKAREKALRRSEAAQRAARTRKANEDAERLRRARSAFCEAAPENVHNARWLDGALRAALEAGR